MRETSIKLQHFGHKVHVPHNYLLVVLVAAVSLWAGGELKNNVGDCRYCSGSCGRDPDSQVIKERQEQLGLCSG